jgi:hypothetical protein
VILSDICHSQPDISTSERNVPDMTDSIDFELPDSYHLTILQINGTPVAELKRPLMPGDSDSLRIRIRPLHRVNAEAKVGFVAMAELHEMEKYHVENQRALARALSGDPGDSEVKLARQWIERFLNEQEKRRRDG